MAKVSLQKCTTYSSKDIQYLILKGMNDIGYDPSVFKNARVAVKPNLVMISAVENALITHPEFFRAVVQIIIDHGGKPVLTECPGFNSLEKVAKKVGYFEIAQELGVEIPEMKDLGVLNYNNAKTFKQIEISKAFFDVDIIINLPKLKTHGLTYLSAAVKNFFGTIPGLRKSRMHMRAPEADAFSEWLLDLNGALISSFEKPKTFLHIMDAITGMEGEGPGPAGTAKDIGAIIIGDDQLAVDHVAASIVNLDHKKILTLTQGYEREFCINSPDEIDIVGESVADLKIHDFVPSRSTITGHMLRGFVVGPTVKNLFVEKPVPQESKCTLCYLCQTVCPAEAISKTKGNRNVPKYDYKKCIRCFCCIEFCPEAAISLKRGKLQWMMGV